MRDHPVKNDPAPAQAFGKNQSAQSTCPMLRTIRQTAQKIFGDDAANGGKACGHQSLLGMKDE